MGHVASGPLYPRDEAPVLIIDDERWPGKIVPAGDEPLTFHLSELIYPETANNLQLIPFYRLHDARYIVYWPTANSDELNNIIGRLQAHEKDALALEAITLDMVDTGQQQPETEHNFRGERTETGIHQNRHWRHATGWFSYELNDRNREATALQVTYFGLDRGRNFDILIDDRLIATERTDGSKGDIFFDIDYPVPVEIVQKNTDGILTVKFKAHEGSLTAGIYHVRLLKE
jgi:hypothetical protein